MAGLVETRMHLLSRVNTENYHCQPKSTSGIRPSSYKVSTDADRFRPRLGHGYRTGYISNCRPFISYSFCLDCMDNPQHGVSMLDSLQSQTQRHFRRFSRPDGHEPWSCSSHDGRESGYLQQTTNMQKKGLSAQTEYSKCFVPHRPKHPVNDKSLTVGAKEDSGFTEGITLQPYTFLPMWIQTNDARRTGRSVMKTDFPEILYLKGSEPLPALVGHALRETGFSRNSTNMSICPAPLVCGMPTLRQKVRPLPDQCCTGPRFNDDSYTRQSVFQEQSGFIHNEPNLQASTSSHPDPQRFVSHYYSNFWAGTALCGAAQGRWTSGGVGKYRENGYTRRDTDRNNLN